MHIQKLILFTEDPERLAAFYSSLPGLHLKQRNKGFSIHLKQTELAFEKASGSPYYHFAFNIPENQILDAKRFIEKITPLLKDHETNQEIIDFVNWNAHAIYFFDPAGNIVEFIARHDLDNASQKDFDGSSLIEVSEIGLPVGDVSEAFKIIHQKAEIPRYSGNFERFCAAGDEHGLFILTGLNRNWFPTRIPSLPFDAEIHFENKGILARATFTEGVLDLNYTKV